ncbi:integrase core domain-containing protein [Bradyrhizobium sp. BR 1433]|uniref:integrase core domain-containing protein n=1 Tax=Bradyrhizobium sp. BR 1433 TaxID=3447967 RepID=UPI003EE58140
MCLRSSGRRHLQCHARLDQGRRSSAGASSRREKPMQNGSIESLNGQMRDELLNESVYCSIWITLVPRMPTESPTTLSGGLTRR